jgi:hypothetical protein
MLARWLAIFPAAAAVLAQTASEPSSISGTVTNSVTGEPILRAHVSVHCTSENYQPGQQAYGALSNAKGEFSVTQLPPGDCWVEVQRAGFVAAVTRTQDPLKGATHQEGVKLTLIPAGVITGRVVNAAGQLVDGVNVAAELPGGNSANSTTDDKGQFRFGGLRPGKYRVKASRQSLPFPPEIRADGSVEMRDAATYYPDSLSAKMAQRIEVRAGAEVSGVEIKLVQVPVIKVSGKVTGVPPGMKDVIVNPVPSGPGASLKADGTFVLWRLDPGKYTLSAQHWGRSPVMSAPIEIEVTTANLQNLELRMVPPFEIAGQLRFDDEQAREQPKPPTRPDGTAPPAPPPQPRTVRLNPPVGLPINGPVNVVISSDDSFTLEKVQPAQYRVAVAGVSGYVKSVRAGDTETDGDTLDVRNGSPGPVTITLSSNFCEISGTVSDSNGSVADAAVMLLRPDDRMSTRMGRSDAKGAYKFRVPPGKYRLAVVDEQGLNWGFQGPDLEDYDAETVELSAGDKMVKDLSKTK